MTEINSSHSSAVSLVERAARELEAGYDYVDILGPADRLLRSLGESAIRLNRDNPAVAVAIDRELADARLALHTLKGTDAGAPSKETRELSGMIVSELERLLARAAVRTPPPEWCTRLEPVAAEAIELSSSESLLAAFVVLLSVNGEATGGQDAGHHLMEKRASFAEVACAFLLWLLWRVTSLDTTNRCGRDAVRRLAVALDRINGYIAYIDDAAG